MLAGALLLTAGSYYFFQSYRPTLAKQVQQVKGAATLDNNGIPFPSSAEKISANVTSGAKQVSYYSQQSKEELQAYYNNILTSDKWAVESQGTYSDFIISRYQKGKVEVSVLTFDFKDGYKSFVSVETSAQ